jgi:hypothetical protein
MWIRKGERDRMMGVDSPIPTQVVSNEEFIPRPQTERQKQVESLIMEWGTRNAKKIGMSRRGYMASSMGLATAFLARRQQRRVEYAVHAGRRGSGLGRAGAFRHPR